MHVSFEQWSQVKKPAKSIRILIHFNENGFDGQSGKEDNREIRLNIKKGNPVKIHFDQRGGGGEEAGRSRLEAARSINENTFLYSIKGLFNSGNFAIDGNPFDSVRIHFQDEPKKKRRNFSFP